MINDGSIYYPYESTTITSWLCNEDTLCNELIQEIAGSNWPRILPGQEDEENEIYLTPEYWVGLPE